MKFIERVEEYLSTLNPEKKKKLYYILAGGGFVIILVVLVVLSTPKQKRIDMKKVEKSQVTLLNDDSYKQAWMADQGARLNSMENSFNRMQNQLNETNKKIDDLAKSISNVADTMRKTADDVMAEQLKKLEDKSKNIEKRIEQNLLSKLDSKIKSYDPKDFVQPIDPNNSNQPVPKNKAIEQVQDQTITSQTQQTQQEFDIDKLMSGAKNQNDTTPQNNTAPKTNQYSKSIEQSQSGSIKLITAENSTNKTKKEEKQTTTIPAGSLIPGILLSGLDAPTSGSVQANPHPVLLMVEKKAILPNRFSMDFRQCFIIGSGYGDLSTERAYLRLETLSCIKKDKTLIEAPISGYIVGHDGKLGVRGKLVSRQGALLAKSLVAGFFSGLSEALKPEKITTVNVEGSSTEKQKYVAPNVEQLMKTGAYSGASNALDKIAQFYIKLAEQMFPVIEVSAGTKIEIVVTKGTRINLSEETNKVVNNVIDKKNN